MSVVQEANVSGEKRYEHVFGDTFAMYTHQEMLEFIEPFKVRFERNGLDAKKIFEGKKCFDAGCGNGRGTLFMLMNGAKHVTCFDFSKTNIESTTRFLKDFNYSEDCFETHQGTLENIPFKDESFDFVWCNGVVMHTKSPNKCLGELSRILKTNGQSWLYIYGSGGVYWRIIYHIREMVKDINIHDCINTLKVLRYPTRYIAEFIDDWYATHLRTYTNADLSSRLEAVGFEKPDLLKYGMDYDTSHRRNMYANEKQQALMGDGDLRYLLTKAQNIQTNNALLLEGEYGSDYPYPTIIKENIDVLFEELKAVIGDRTWLKLAIPAHIQRELRIILNKQELFNLEEITNIIRTLIEQAKSIKNL